MSGPHCVPFVKQAWWCCFSILVWVGINIQSDCWLLQEICNYAQAGSNLRAVSWGLKYRWFLFYTKLDHYFQNEHHAVLKNSWNYRLRPWTHEESVYWGSESREKEAHFLISSNTIMLLCATSGITPLEAPFIFHRGRAAATKTSLLHHEVWSSDENFFWKMQTMQPDRRLYSSAERPQSILVSDHQMEVCGPINIRLFGVVDVKICKTFCPPPSVFHWNSKGNKTCKVSRGASAPLLGD